MQFHFRKIHVLIESPDRLICVVLFHNTSPLDGHLTFGKPQILKKANLMNTRFLQIENWFAPKHAGAQTHPTYESFYEHEDLWLPSITLSSFGNFPSERYRGLSKGKAPAAPTLSESVKHTGSESSSVLPKSNIA